MATDGATLTPLADSPDELTRLRREAESLRASLQHTQSRLAESSREVEFLRTLRDQLLEQQQEKERTIASLQHQLQQLLRRYYGRSAEKIDPNQLLLFESLLNQLAPPANPADSGATPDETESAAPESRKPRGHGHGRRRLPTNLEREKRVHDLPEEQKPCPGCGTMRHVIGQEISEQLDYVPARLRVIEHVRLTYPKLNSLC